MLHVFRKHRQRMLSVLITGFLGLLMLNFGLGSYFSEDPAPEAITVDDTKLSMNDYLQKKEQILNVYRNQYGKSFPQISKFLNIEQQTTDALINEVLLQRFIAELGLSVGPNQLREYVTQNLFPQGFSTDAYRSFLRQVGMNGAKFEATLQRQLVTTQLMNLVRDLNIVTEAEARTIFNNEQGKFKFSYLTIRRQDFEKEVKTENEETLKEFFENEAERYRIPRKVRYSYVPFKTEDHLSAVEVTEDDLLESFREQQQDFREPKTILLKQLVLQRKTTEKGNELEAMVLGKDEQAKAESKPKEEDVVLERAKDIVAKVKAGTSFDTLIQESTTEHAPGAAQGLGTWTEVKKLSPEIRRAVQNLKAHEVSDPIKTDSTITIVRVEDVKEASTKSFDDVRPIIEASYRRSQAPTYARAAAETFLRSVKKSPQPDSALPALATEKKLSFLSTGMPLPEREDPAGVAKGLTKKAAELEQGAIDIVTIDESTYIVQVQEVKESEIPSFENAREAVRKDFIAEDSKRLAREFAESLRKSASEELAKLPSVKEQDALAVLSKLAASKNMTVTSTALLTPNDTSETLLQNPRVREAAFGLRSETPLASDVFDTGPALYVLALAEHVLPPEADYAQNRAKILETEKQRSAERVMKALVAALKKRSEVIVNPSLDKTEL